MHMAELTAPTIIVLCVWKILHFLTPLHCNVAKQNRNDLSNVSTNSKQSTGAVDDIKYVMSVEKGHIH